MVKHLGPPTFFLTLLCADLRWNELVSIIYKLKGQDVSQEFISNLTYHERCNLLNSNRLSGTALSIPCRNIIGETTYYAIRVEFQVRTHPLISLEKKIA